MQSKGWSHSPKAPPAVVSSPGRGRLLLSDRRGSPAPTTAELITAELVGNGDR